jgi:cellobiose-specific phosphotransferase system component IIA
VTPSDRRDAARWLGEAIALGDLERVPPNMSAAGERINDARRHVRSARTIAEDDLTLAIAACHDAIRKAITAHMTANGYRARGGDGAHRIVLVYARNQLATTISTSDLDDADELRRDRGLAEYGEFAHSKLRTSDVLAAAELAERIVNAIARALAAKPGKRKER